MRILMGGALLGLVATLAACGPATFVVGIEPGQQQYEAKTVESAHEWFAPRVAMISISGMIYDFNRPGLLHEGPNPVSDLAEKLEKAAHDSRVKAVILRINSPGGTVTASDAMYREVMRFKKKTHKPVVVLMMDVAASGGYYVACAGDRIVAYPTTITGSIGVILQTISVKHALDSIGIRAETFASGPNKDTGSPLSNLTDEQRKLLQGLVNDFYHKFVAIVKARRPHIPAAQFAQVTDGRVYPGDQALKVGLVDEVGDLHDAFALAKKLAHLKAADLVLYHRPLKYVGSPYAAASVPAPTGTTQINLAQFNLSEPLLDSTPGFYYLWEGPEN